MQTEFTPLLSLIGGGLIGLSAVLYLASNGRIAGISSIVGRLVDVRENIDNPNNFKPSLAFIIGLLLAAPLYYFSTNGLPEQLMTSNKTLLLAAGLLAGIGSALGSGCTSGHGVCGISRGSKRSIAATITFMITAFITVYILRHVIGA